MSTANGSTFGQEDLPNNWIVAIVVLALYKLDKLYPTIMRDLIDREARGVM
ncbi:hypothetical protein [Selenomonas felix]|uniref:hypothetical protein n=1 Tax=Selenomonas felix TaxID=1944634 RepID=UPI0014823AB9|nr:hypothetical protein [Selenomonas felix]